jgi:hypothetical protein
MEHIQAVIQPVLKRSGLDEGVEQRCGHGDHLRVAVLGLVEPAEEAPRRSPLLTML